MTVTFIRHAARSSHQSLAKPTPHLSGVIDDPSLNDLGHRQAQVLAEFSVDGAKIPRPTHLYSSPRKRAQETLAPTSAALNLKIKIDPRLDECRSSENATEFRQRIVSLINEFAAQAADPKMKFGEIYVCSHFDWLETVLPLLPSDLKDSEITAGWGHCEFRVFEISDGLWKFLKGGRITATEG
jgi:broad specificity phosphatase PhoE